jgi:hypothetical protein
MAPRRSKTKNHQLNVNKTGMIQSIHFTINLQLYTTLLVLNFIIIIQPNKVTLAQ